MERKMFINTIKNKIKILSFFIIAAFVFMPFYSQTANAANEPSSAPSKTLIPNNAVAPFGEVLFLVDGNIGSVSAEQRAVIVSAHIKEILSAADFVEEALIALKDETSDNYNISYNGKVVFTIDNRQAAKEGKSKEEIAQNYRKIIIKALQGQTGKNLIKKRIIFAVRILLAIFLLVLTRFVFRRINKLYMRLQYIVKQEQDKIPPIITKILGSSRQETIIESLLKCIRIIILLLIIIIDIMAALWLFPQTRSIAMTVTNYIAVPLKNFAVSFWNYIPNLFVIIVILSIYYAASKILKLAALKVDDKTINFKGFHSDWAIPTYNIMRAALLIFILICIFPYLPNSNSDIFKGMSVFVGLLLSLGSASIVNNIVSGFVITYMRPFQIGDRIKMGDNIGDVIEKTALVTRIRTVKNELITIPNSHIMTAYTVNYTKSAQDHGLILYKDVTVAFAVPWRKVHGALLEAAQKTSNILQEPKPFIIQTELGDYGAKYQLNVYVKDARLMQKTTSELFENIQDIFNREHIDLDLQRLYQNTVKIIK